jgi:acyl-CoA thioester hydrolase
MFYDVDPMGIVWHGNYVRYLEVARSALLTRLGYDYEQMAASGYGWPIVDLRLKYRKPAMLKQPVKVRAEIVEYENRLKIDYLLSDVATGTRLTTGYTIQVAVDLKTAELQFVCPQALWTALGVEP